MEHEAHRQNMESRIETLNEMHRRFIDGIRKLGGHNAVVFSSPLCDIYLRAIAQLEDFDASNNSRKVISLVTPDYLKPEDNG